MRSRLTAAFEAVKARADFAEISAHVWVFTHNDRCRSTVALESATAVQRSKDFVVNAERRYGVTSSNLSRALGLLGRGNLC